MRTLLRTAAVLALSAPMAAGGASAQDGTLYQRLGGYDAIAAVVDELLARMEEQKFSSASDDSRMRTRQLIVDFICQETGGPCHYAGRDIATAHAGLGIDEAVWDRFVVTFGDTLDGFDVPERERNELAGLLLPMKDQVVEP